MSGPPEGWEYELALVCEPGRVSARLLLDLEDASLLLRL